MTREKIRCVIFNPEELVVKIQGRRTLGRFVITTPPVPTSPLLPPVFYYARCEALTITHPRTAELAGHPSTPTFAVSVDSGLKELITFRESRAQMIAPLPMVLAGLAGFSGAAGCEATAGCVFWALVAAALRAPPLRLRVFAALRPATRCLRVAAALRAPPLRLRVFAALRPAARRLRVATAFFPALFRLGLISSSVTTREGIKPEVACSCKTCHERTFHVWG